MRRRPIRRGGLQGIAFPSAAVRRIAEIIKPCSVRNAVNIRAVFLDMDHTLCDTERADQLAVRDFQEQLARLLDHEAAAAVSRKYLRVIYGEYRHRDGWQKIPGEPEIAFRARLLEKTAAEIVGDNRAILDPAAFAQLFMDLRIRHFAFFPGVAEMLRDLRTSYTLVVVSNGPLFSQEPKVARVEMDRHVDHILLGGALPHEKPHPLIFRMACDKACCEPAEAIHVGDSLESDIRGASNAGITSVWLNSGEQVRQPVPAPDHTIRHIRELVDVLNRLK